jgi:hypothetical protein
LGGPRRACTGKECWADAPRRVNAHRAKGGGDSKCFLVFRPRERNYRSTNGPHPIPFARKEQSDVERDD